MNKNRALITGITGQDGSYLSELLLEKGYEVGGIVRRLSTPGKSRIRHVEDKLKLYEGDLTDNRSLLEAVWDFEPTEIYNLGAQTFVGTSWTQPILTSNVTALGALNMLEALKEYNESSINPGARFYQASSSEQFGEVSESPQDEYTPFHPRSPYGVSKCYAHHMTVNYRESYDLYASCGILFNHESPRRGEEFITRKVTKKAAEIATHGVDKVGKLEIGNLQAQRDWGHAKDYVKAMWLMLNELPYPDDFVVATGSTYSIEDLLREAFLYFDLDWTENYRVNPKFVRPAEVVTLRGESAKARMLLGWEPVYTFQDMIREMCQHDYDQINNQSYNLVP